MTAESTYSHWRRLDVEAFRLQLQQSALCSDDGHGEEDAEAIADLYNSELTTIVDRMVPWRTTTRRTRPSDPWFDDDCRDAKRRCRRLERHAWRSSDARTAWKSELRAYRRLTGSKREAFWNRLITDQRSKPRQMWQSIDKLLGRGHLQGCDDISASDFHSFFDKKVADIRASFHGQPRILVPMESAYLISY